MPPSTASPLATRTALPTRTVRAIRRGKFALLPLCPRDPEWPTLTDGDPLALTRWAFALADRPDLVRGLKAKLPAIKATKEEMAGWLTALNSSDEKEWKAAWETLRYFRPAITLTPREQCKLMTTDRGRALLVHLTKPDEPRPTPP